MKTKIIYARVSTSNKRKKIDADGNVSLYEQNPMLQIPLIHESYPESIDAEVLIEKRSAYKNEHKRLVFNSIIERIKAGEVSDLYLFDLDRAYRNRSLSMQLFEMCIKHDCKIHSVNQKWLDQISSIQPSSIAQLVSGIVTNVITWMSEEDSRNKSEKIKSAVRKQNNITLSANGRKWGRRNIIPQAHIALMIQLKKSGLNYKDIQQAIEQQTEKKYSTSTIWEKTNLNNTVKGRHK